jgi:formylglycine-generating enzyme required for sulfatase activity
MKEYKQLRGGCWFNLHKESQVSYRCNFGMPSFYFHDVGFRVCLSDVTLNGKK